MRVVGGGHSWTDVVCTDGQLLSLDRMKRVLAIDPERREVTVEAGIRLFELNAALREAGLGLSTLGSISEQSIAGAIATGTHGSGLGYGNLASQVVALRLVTPSGEVLDLSRENEPELFRAARVSLGCLGVVTRVTLRCEPAFNLRERSRQVPFERALGELGGWASAAEHMKLWWLPHTENVWHCAYDRSSREPTRTGAARRWLDDRVLAPALFPMLLRVGRLAPPLIPTFNRWVSATSFRELERVAWAPEVFNVQSVPRHDESEWALPLAGAAEALGEMRQLIARERLRVNFIVEVRFAAGDDAMLSPAHGRATCHLGAYMFRSPGWERYFDAFEDLMIARGGRPHWGKARRIEPAHLRTVYPEYDAFDGIRRRLDPLGIMSNAFVRRVFGATAGR